jgi:RecA/RadA recombinase
MAKSSKIVKNTLETNSDVNDYKQQVTEFFNSINKTSEPGEKATLLGETDSTIPFYISTQSTILDTIITNKENGGIPVGRITEIYGAPSCVTEDTIVDIIVD